MKDVCPEYIRDFLELIYPLNVELAMASFNAEVCIRDATAQIRTLQARVAELEARTVAPSPLSEGEREQ